MAGSIDPFIVPNKSSEQSKTKFKSKFQSKLWLLTEKKMTKNLASLNDTKTKNFSMTSDKSKSLITINFFSEVINFGLLEPIPISIPKTSDSYPKKVTEIFQEKKIFWRWRYTDIFQRKTQFGLKNNRKRFNFSFNEGTRRELLKVTIGFSNQY